MNNTETIEITDIDNIEQSAINKLDKDLREAAKLMSKKEASFLVQTYYLLQGNRIREKNRLRQLGDEPAKTIAYFSDNFYFLEKQVPKMLQLFAENDFVGKWLLSICGIGPVIAAGLLAHLDIEKAPNAGHFLSFSGMAGNGKEWNKGEKRPWNADLKVLLWKAGESFVKVSGREQGFYGHHYIQWKSVLQQRNDNGFYKDLSASILAGKKFGKDTEAYKAYSIGKLPPAHVHAMARRKAIGLFVNHLWEVMYRNAFPTRECRPCYAIDHLGHSTYIPIPNDPFQ